MFADSSAGQQEGLVLEFSLSCLLPDALSDLTVLYPWPLLWGTVEGDMPALRLSSVLFPRPGSCWGHRRES